MIQHTDKIKPIMTDPEIDQIEATIDRADAKIDQINKEWRRIKEEAAQIARESSSTWQDMKKYIKPIGWDWPRWLPRGFLTILASEPGMGKSLLCLRIAAAYLTGQDWPDRAPFTGHTGEVIWCEGEASQALNLARAEALDLQLSSILSPLPHPLTAFRIDDNDHMIALLTLCRRPETRFVVMDSLSSLNYAGSTPQLLYKLSEIARVSRQPILLTHHLRKRTSLDENGRINLERLRGTSRIAQTARVIWTLDTPDYQNPAHRRLAVAKNNLLPPPDPLGMKITNHNLQFGPPPALNIQTPSQLDTAIQFLLNLLNSAPLPFNQIVEAANQAGITLGTLRRAKKHLGVRSRRLPDQTWTWSLPKNE